MNVYEVKNPNIVEHLFRNFHESFSLAYLQGFLGTCYTDNINNPESSKLIVGDFCLLAGKPNINVLNYKPNVSEKKFLIMTPENAGWQEFIEKAYLGGFKKITRYTLEAPPEGFNISFLKDIIAGLPNEYRIVKINEDIFRKTREIEWTKDWCWNFEDFKVYEKHGLGIAILEGDEIVSGASSYIFYKNGIEIQIDTRKDKQLQGLGLVAGAKMILECLDRNIYPHWDAHNEASRKLAEKLGYRLSKEYTAYEIFEY